jgi:hypothetical protein
MRIRRADEAKLFDRNLIVTLWWLCGVVLRVAPFSPATKADEGGASLYRLSLRQDPKKLNGKCRRCRNGSALPLHRGPRIAVVSNPRSHRNRHSREIRASPEFLFRSPRNSAELADTLANFAARGVELLVVDGGDGTVRDVLTSAGDLFGSRFPRIAIIPSGKTNAIALDLGLPLSWTLDDVLRAAKVGKVRRRSPIEIYRPGSTVPDLRGFLFGAGAFVRATALAQHTHKAGAFNGLAVGLSLIWAVAQTALG